MHAAANNGGSDAVRNMIEAEVVGGVDQSEALVTLWQRG